MNWTKFDNIRFLVVQYGEAKQNISCASDKYDRKKYEVEANRYMNELTELLLTEVEKENDYEVDKYD